MDDATELRVARNETIFRDVNEAIQSGRWPGEKDAAAFRCECGLFGCTRLLELDISEYERIRAHPRQFLVAVDHNLPEAETVVEQHATYLVIEKQGRAGEVAEATDPRR